jgi:hypothetical protein
VTACSSNENPTDAGPNDATGDHDATTTDGAASDVTLDGSTDAVVDDASDAATCGNVTSLSTIVTLASGQSLPQYLAIDAMHVYWTTSTGGTVMVAAIDGGAQTTIATGQDHPHGIAVDSTNVYWVNHASVKGSGAIMTAPLDGGSPTALLVNQSQPNELVVAGGRLYWTDVIDGTITSAAIDGGDVQTIVSGQTDPWFLTIDGSTIFWTNFAPQVLSSVPLDGGTPKVLVSSPSGQFAGRPAAGAAKIAWTVCKQPNGPCTRWMADQDGTNSVQIATAAQMWGVAIDTSIYAQTTTGITRFPLDGGCPVTITPGTLAPKIVLDSTSVYWVTDFGGTVMSATPK